MGYEHYTMPEADSTQAPPKRCRRHEWEHPFPRPAAAYFLKPVEGVLGPANGYPWNRYRVCSHCGAFAVFYPYSRITRRLNEVELRTYGTGNGLATDAARWNEYVAQEGGAK